MSAQSASHIETPAKSSPQGSRRPPRVTSREMSRRLHRLAELQADGFSRSELLRFASRKWAVSRRSAQLYLARITAVPTGTDAHETTMTALERFERVRNRHELNHEANRFCDMVSRMIG